MSKQNLTPEEKQDLLMFGIWQSPTGPRPILERQFASFKACTKCKGFGTYGMPLCGALYICKKCNGTGRQINKIKTFFKNIFKTKGVK